MPRQTDQVSKIVFPDGFAFAIDSGSGFEQIGVMAGGATATLGWTDYYYDAGNYEGLIDRAKNPMFTVSPSAILNWDPAVIARLFPGMMVNTGTNSPSAGFDVDYAGSSNQVTLTRVSLRLSHFPSVPATATLVGDDITAIAGGSNNQIVTVPLSTFTDVLVQTATKIDGYITIPTMSEVPYASRDLEANQGDFYTDATNLYILVDLGTYADSEGDGGLAAAKTDLAGTIVSFYDDLDWNFVFYNAKIEAGGSFNFKGVNEDGLNEITVSFTGKPDPDNSYRLFNYFNQT